MKNYKGQQDVIAKGSLRSKLDDLWQHLICAICVIRLVKARFTRGLESVVLRVFQL